VISFTLKDQKTQIREIDNMRQHTITLYKFDELSPEAQQEAIQKWREGMDWSIESEMITEGFEYRLEELGYPTEDIGWSLSYSQGDGVAFYGDVDVSKVANRLLEGEVLELFNRIVEEDLSISISLIRNSYGYHYSHWNTMEVIIDGDDDDTMMYHLYPELEESADAHSNEYREKANAIQNVFDELLAKVDIDIKTVSRELERSGYEQIEYYESDEAIAEEIRANDYEFEVDGAMY
jgi:hypothetical protein